jgi:Uri superfamily endonuclease
MPSSIKASDSIRPISSPSTLHSLGPACSCGTYLLRIDVTRPVRLRFGRFAGGAPIALQAGCYAYIGSAMARKGSASLVRRALRHATRSGQKPPHALRGLLLEHFTHIGLCSSNRPFPMPNKTVHWHIDHLLDLERTNLHSAFFLHGAESLEADIAKLVLCDVHAVAFTPGLGAGDAPGQTHLLRIDSTPSWWTDIPHRLAATFSLEPFHSTHAGGAK